jgi:hypothetical protein
MPGGAIIPRLWDDAAEAGAGPATGRVSAPCAVGYYSIPTLESPRNFRRFLDWEAKPDPARVYLAPLLMHATNTT